MSCVHLSVPSLLVCDPKELLSSVCVSLLHYMISFFNLSPRVKSFIAQFFSNIFCENYFYTAFNFVHVILLYSFILARSKVAENVAM